MQLNHYTLQRFQNTPFPIILISDNVSHAANVGQPI